MYNKILQITKCSEALQIFDLAYKSISISVNILYFTVILFFFIMKKKQNNASKLLLAIMESRHDSENAEKILYKMRPNELVSSATSYNSAAVG